MINIFHVIDGIHVHVPAYGAGRVNNGVLRVEAPFERTARRVVPNNARTFGRRNEQIVDEVEAVLKFTVHLDDLRVKHGGFLRDRTVAFCINRRRIDLIAFADLFLFALEIGAGVGDLNRIHIVRIKTENRNAAVSQDFAAINVVLNLRAIRLRNNAY